MNEGTEIDLSELRGLASSLSTASGNISETLLRLRGDVSLLLGDWTGEAANAFDDAYQGWTTNMTDLQGDLDSFVNSLYTVADTYEAADEAVVERCG